MMSKAFPLVMAAIGEQVYLESIKGGKKMLRRLTALGLTPGVELNVVQNTGGVLLLSVRGSRIALGRGMARKMMVSLTGNNGNQTNIEGEEK
jgi:ferrous iron transport protein A